MMIRATTALVLAGACAHAQVPEYLAPQLQARSNFSGAFNLPDVAFFTGSTPDINDARQVSIRIGVIGGTESDGLWVGKDGAGSILYFSPDVIDSGLSDVTINNAGVAAADQRFTSPAGVVLYDTGAMTGGVEYTQFELGVTGLGTPIIADNGGVGYRGAFGFSGNVFKSQVGAASFVHAAEAGVDSGSPYSFLFTANYNANGDIAAKARYGGPGEFGEAQPDRVLLFHPDGSTTRIAEDADALPGSPFSRFDNSVAVSDTGLVAFTATLVGGGRGVFLSDGSSTVTIATEANPDVSEIEFFRSDVNDSGLVVFRAKDGAGLRAIFVGDGTTLSKIVVEHQLVDTDLGTGQINENNPGDPVFGGGPTINRCGDVAFGAALTPPGQDGVEWGSGVFVIIARPAGDADLDGDVDFSDLNILLSDFGEMAPNLPGDVNGDGEVNFTDLNAVLSGFGDSCG